MKLELLAVINIIYANAPIYFNTLLYSTENTAVN